APLRADPHREASHLPDPGESAQAPPPGLAPSRFAQRRALEIDPTFGARVREPDLAAPLLGPGHGEGGPQVDLDLEGRIRDGAGRRERPLTAELAARQAEESPLAIDPDQELEVAREDRGAGDAGGRAARELLAGRGEEA